MICSIASALFCWSPLSIPAFKSYRGLDMCGGAYKHYSRMVFRGKGRNCRRLSAYLTDVFRLIHIHDVLYAFALDRSLHFCNKNEPLL